MDKAALFIFNVFVNGFLSFCTAVLLVEAIVFLCRIKQGRTASLLRTIPVLKLPFDLFLYDFSRWSYLQGVDPRLCEEGTRTLSVSFRFTGFSFDRLFLPWQSAIECTLPCDRTFTMADCIGSMMNKGLLLALSAAALLLSVCRLIRKLAVLLRCRQSIRSLQIGSNFRLQTRIKKRTYRVFVSEAFQGSPFVTGLFSPVVTIPIELFRRLSRKEYEAVLAHETEHVRKADVFTRLIVDLIASIFWWVPTKRLRKRIEEGQEIGCDDGCEKYGVDPVDLASALYKSAQYARKGSGLIFARSFTELGTHGRVARLLQPFPRRKTHCLCACLAAGLAFSLIFFGRFWIF